MWAGCSVSSPFLPREVAIPKPEDWELNRGRVELRYVSGYQQTDPEEAGFPAARQIASVTRVFMRKDKKSKETVLLLTGLDANKANGENLKKIKRAYWGIESQLHYRLDNVLDEDRSRVRTPSAALVLGMFRRVVVGSAIAWSREKKNQQTHLHAQLPRISQRRKPPPRLCSCHLNIPRRLEKIEKSAMRFWGGLP